MKDIDRELLNCLYTIANGSSSVNPKKLYDCYPLCRETLENLYDLEQNKYIHLQKDDIGVITEIKINKK